MCCLFDGELRPLSDPAFRLLVLAMQTCALLACEKLLESAKLLPTCMTSTGAFFHALLWKSGWLASRRQGGKGVYLLSATPHFLPPSMRKVELWHRLANASSTHAKRILFCFSKLRLTSCRTHESKEATLCRTVRMMAAVPIAQRIRHSDFQQAIHPEHSVQSPCKDKSLTVLS